MHKVFLALILSSTIMLSGCLPLLLGGVATAGYITSQERGTKAAFRDIKIKALIKDRLTAQYYKYLTQVEVTVLNGNVLLTGVVKSRKAASEVEVVVRGVDGVKSIYNELFSDGNYPPTQYAKDSWIATQLKSYLFAENGVHSANYNILVVNGHAYVFGLAGSMSERESVRHLARTTRGVAQVHSDRNIYKAKPLISNRFFSFPSVDTEEDVFE